MGPGPAPTAGPGARPPAMGSPPPSTATTIPPITHWRALVRLTPGPDATSADRVEYFTPDGDRGASHWIAASPPSQGARLATILLAASGTRGLARRVLLNKRWGVTISPGWLSGRPPVRASRDITTQVVKRAEAESEFDHEFRRQSRQFRVSRALIALRALAGISQPVLSRRTGFTVTMITRTECGWIGASVPALIVTAHACGARTEITVLTTHLTPLARLRPLRVATADITAARSALLTWYSETVEHLRARSGLSCTALAARMGLSRRSLRFHRRGQKAARVDTLDRLAAATGTLIHIRFLVRGHNASRVPPIVLGDACDPLPAQRPPAPHPLPHRGGVTPP